MFKIKCEDRIIPFKFQNTESKEKILQVSRKRKGGSHIRIIKNQNDI